ncbi:MAG: outer membrane lipoprotein carrier protein LolA [Paracoccaceae bacterium]
MTSTASPRLRPSSPADQSDQTISTGVIKIQRPGRARFEYNPPDPGDRRWPAAARGVRRQVQHRPQQYLLKETPLNLILAQSVDLNCSGMVVGHSYDGTATTVTAQDPDFPEYGTIRIDVHGQSRRARQWIITDGSGAETAVILGDVKTGMSYPTATFSINAEVAKRGR